MIEFPKIKGIKWVSESFPDLIALDITLLDRKINDLGIEGMKVLEIASLQYIDLSKLAGIREFYPDNMYEPSSTECSVDIDGIANFIANVSVKDMKEAWVFYKTFKYATRNS